MTGAFFARNRSQTMPDPQVAALASDPNARVMVFIDGQNLYKSCKEIFGHPLCHPHLLAKHLAGQRTNRPVACRFYTGRPNPNISGETTKTSHLDRRLNMMRAAGVTVLTRPLRYHWDWGHRRVLPKAEPGASPQQVLLTPWQRPQEKGIDLLIALDAVEFVLTSACDVAIIVSLDRDLFEIPQAIKNLKRFIPGPVRLEAAVPVSDTLSQPKTIARFDYTHQITSRVFALVRDDTDYTASIWPPSSSPAAP